MHTIGSQKYFGHFAFQQTAAFHYKKVILSTDTEEKTDEKHDIQMENRKTFFYFFYFDIVQLELIGPFTKASLLNAQHHTVF